MKRAILLVEDNPADEKLTLRAFRKSEVPVEVVVVRDGAEALDWLLGRGPHAGRDPSLLPAVVLLDLKMPRIDGLEVLRRIRSDERTRSVPVVVLTASREEKDVLDSYSIGANAYVQKPVEFAEFVETTRTIGRFWVEINVPAPARRSPE